VKTDNRGTRQRNEAESGEAKVVRLSDWLGPEDELVPFGPRAHARTATHEPDERLADPESDAEPPAASGFWDGDTSVHTAVPGPGIFDEPGEPPAERRRHLRPAPAWRPALPRLHPVAWGSRVGEAFADRVDGISWPDRIWPDRISWPWAAGGVGLVALAAVVLVATLAGSSSGHRRVTAQAAIGDQPLTTLSGSLGELGLGARPAAATDLQRIPRVKPAVRMIGAAAARAHAVQARHRRPAVVAPASYSSSSTTGSVDTTTLAPSETTPAPTETEPTQTTSTTAPTTGWGGTSSGGGSASGSSSSPSSQKQSAFGSSGSLGPGSSPNG
jgi:hypothetical protein